jgi:hypothetical protein
MMLTQQKRKPSNAPAVAQSNGAQAAQESSGSPTHKVKTKAKRAKKTGAHKLKRKAKSTSAASSKRPRRAKGKENEPKQVCSSSSNSCEQAKAVLFFVRS